MSVQSQIDRISAAVSDQTGLIRRIQEALTGKGIVGTAAPVLTVKTGTASGGTIDTGLSQVEQFFLYKESQTEAGLIHLHYSRETGTSHMYASAWSDNNDDSKSIVSGTGAVSVSGGTVTVSAAQAAQGGLSSSVTYKWIAVGTEEE